MPTQTHPEIDWKSRIKAQEGTVLETARLRGTGQTGQRNAAHDHYEEENQRVDWKAVAQTQAWLEKEWAAGRRGYAGPPGAYDIVPSAVPEEVGQIGGVLLARCAGYPQAPKATDVVAAINADTPTRREREALETYLLEATSTEVKMACQAGEIDLRKLMRRVEKMLAKNGTYGLRSIEQWLTR